MSAHRGRQPFGLAGPVVRPAAMTHVANPLQAPLKLIGFSPTPGQLVVVTVAAVAVPLVLVGGVAAYAWWKSRKAAGPKSAIDRSGANSLAGAQVSSAQLRRAWKRFLKELPGDYERSILNFEHFVVFGAAASGKSRLVDVYSDWRAQAKQRPGSQPNDADLPVYLASGVIISELPARFLIDNSPRCQTALRNLWKPLYRRRSPTVVVTVDVRRLKDSTPEALQELAESIRAKLNLLSSIRGRPIEVRVALTFLDAFEGYPEFARFCRDQSIPMRVDLVVGDSAQTQQAHLDAWFDALREHLPLALTRMPPAEYLRVVSFLRRLPEIAAPLGKFVTPLFAHEALSFSPSRGGLFMLSEPAGPSSPLDRAAERGPGPDPRRPHLLGTAIVATAIITYLVAAYREQRESFVGAQAALQAYGASRTQDASEKDLRGRVTSFTAGERGFIASHPDYFESARVALRKSLSDAIRDRIILSQFALVGKEGRAGADTRDIPARRAMYFLTLLHSDKADRLQITGPSRLRLWERMTGLSADLITDYIKTTDTAYKQPFSVDVRKRDIDPSTTWHAWTEFLQAVEAAVKAGARRPDELRKLSKRADDLENTLMLYEEDPETVKLLDGLDTAAGTATAMTLDAREGSRQLKQHYKHEFSDFFDYEPQYQVHEQSEKLTSVLQVVHNAGVVHTTGSPLLRDLVTRLKAAADSDGDGKVPEEARITMGGQTFAFDSSSWDAMLRGSTGREMVEQFLRASAGGSSIFFDVADDQALPSKRWNPANDGSSLFIGRGEIPGRYTKAAYDRHVASAVKSLPEALERAKVPDEQRRQVTLMVTESVRRYATDYRAQISSFIRSFTTIRTPSPEALRVALAEIVKTENTSYQEFLTLVSQNTNIDNDKVPALQPMLDNMTEFRVWREVVGEHGEGAELGKYRNILKQLQDDMGQAAGAAPEAAASGPDTLEKALSPVGKLVLSEVKGEKGSYAGLVNSWLSSVGLPDYQRLPFTAPTSELSRLGRREIERQVAMVWENELLPDVRRLASRFPFDQSSPEDITPAELSAVLHPQTGRYFDVFRRYFEPLSDFGDGGPFRAKPSVRGRLALPGQLYDLTNRTAAISAKLWDHTGKPTPLVLRVATVPFEHGRNPELAQTLEYLNVGTNSLFNFNQKPSEISLPLDWTKEYNAQVGVQLTDMSTKDNSFPEPLRAEGSFWSFMHLLKRGKAEPAKSPPWALLYTWEFQVGRTGNDTMTAQYVVVDDVWGLFALGPYVRSRLTVAPTAAGR
jgi:hypothetical protein